jgi:hypothetical protein
MAKAHRFMKVGRRYSPDPCHSTLGDDFHAAAYTAQINVARRRG